MSSGSLEGELRQQLLLLATLVVSITYVAGNNPPGGVWQEDGAGHKAGDHLLRATHHGRYHVFQYCNATAFAASLVVIFLLLLKMPTKKGQLAFLRGVMVMDLLSLMGAYLAAGCRKSTDTVYAAALVVGLSAYVGVHVLQAFSPPSSSPPQPAPAQAGGEAGVAVGAGAQAVGGAGAQAVGGAGAQAAGAEDQHLLRPKEQRKVMLLLATFATALTYLAGLNAPGGYWNGGESRLYHPGDALVAAHHSGHFKMFFYCNTTTFIASLFIVVLLLDERMSDKAMGARSVALYVFVVGALVCLFGAYAAGSSRDTDTGIYVLCLVAAVLLYIFVVMMVLTTAVKRVCGSAAIDAASPGHGDAAAAAAQEGSSKMGRASKKVKSLILLLATLAATVTYQAGLDPPGGVWPESGDPILLSTHPRRYKAFFYCNSIAFLLSLAAILLVQNERLVKSHRTLLATVMLDMCALVGAYAAGSYRDVKASIYAVVLAVVVLVYVMVHVVFCTADVAGNDRKVKKRHKRLLLLAILVATITYQAGLTPPGGFWQGDAGRHAAGNAVLRDNYPRRFAAFFYCNSTSFMASILLILLFVSPNLYRLAIKCYALYAGIVVALVGVMVAYVAGCARRRQTSLYICALVVAVAAIIAVRTTMFCGFLLEKENDGADEDGSVVAASSARSAQETKYREEYAIRKYLMLIGVLAASVTYTAGLYPPGGVWQDDGGRRQQAGSPVLERADWLRYRIFFYSNSMSFVASVVVIALLLQQILRSHQAVNNQRLLRATNTAVVLDLLGLLVAYGAGSTRELESAIWLGVLVLACVAIHVAPWLCKSAVDQCEPQPSRSQYDQA